MDGSGVTARPLTAKSQLWFTTAQTVSLAVFTPQSPNVMSPVMTKPQMKAARSVPIIAVDGVLPFVRIRVQPLQINLLVGRRQPFARCTTRQQVRIVVHLQHERTGLARPLNVMPLNCSTSLNSAGLVRSSSVCVRHAMLTVCDEPLLFVPARIVAVLPTMPYPPLPVVAVAVDSRLA